MSLKSSYFGLPVSTVFDRRIPKQKFYENMEVSSSLRRVFVENISGIFWRNKLAVSSLNVSAGEMVEEVEVLEVRLTRKEFDSGVLRQIDKAIPYHILFVLSYDGLCQAWIGFKEVASTGKVSVSRYFHSEWVPEEEMLFSVDGFSMDSVYEGLVRQVGGESLKGEAGEGLKEAVVRDGRREELEKNIAALEKKMYKEKQVNRQFEMNAEIRKLKRMLRELQ